MGIAHRTGPSDVVTRIDFWIPTLLLAFGLTLVATVLFSQTPPSGGGASAPAGGTPAGAASGAPAPTVGRVDPTKAEAKKPRISLASYERSGDYLKATYNFFFKNQGDDGLTLNDWDLCLVGWEAPYVFDVRLVGDDKSRIVDLGPIDYLSYRPNEAEAALALSTLRPDDSDRARGQGRVIVLMRPNSPCGQA